MLLRRERREFQVNCYWCETVHPRQCIVLRCLSTFGVGGHNSWANYCMIEMTGGQSIWAGKIPDHAATVSPWQHCKSEKYLTVISSQRAKTLRRGRKIGRFVFSFFGRCDLVFNFSKVAIVCLNRTQEDAFLPYLVQIAVN